MRIWKETSLNSFLFSIIAVTTCVAVSPEYVESCKTLWCHQSLFGWDSKGKTRPPGKQSRMGGGKKGVFEAWVNEVLSPIWGEEERMSERLPVRQTVIPADRSFDSKDKCQSPLQDPRAPLTPTEVPICGFNPPTPEMLLCGSNGSPATAMLCCSETYERISPPLRFWHPRQHQSAGLRANWSFEHRGAPHSQAKWSSAFVRHFVANEACCCQSFHHRGNSTDYRTRQSLVLQIFIKYFKKQLLKVILCNTIWSRFSFNY